ncbi:MAG: metal ABC transporter permease [Candidatus Babeliales bacterium]
MFLHCTIAAIVCLTAVACAIPGMFLVLRGVALLSDAISHSILLGIVLMFLLTGSLESPLLFFGAALAGVAMVACTEQLIATTRLKKDAAISLVFPLFFSLGVIMVSMWVRNVHLDVDMILLGEVALAPFNRLILFGADVGPRAVWVLGSMIIVSLLLLRFFFYSFIFSLFDPAGASVAGLKPQRLYYGLMLITSMTAVAAFDIVGSVVVVALMITPGATAYLLARTMHEYMGYTVGIACLSGLLGYAFAAWANVSVAGSIATAAGALFLCVFAWYAMRNVRSVTI